MDLLRQRTCHESEMRSAQIIICERYERNFRLVQGSNGDRKTWKKEMVMEKSCDMKNKPKVMEICEPSWNFT